MMRKVDITLTPNELTQKKGQESKNTQRQILTMTSRLMKFRMLRFIMEQEHHPKPPNLLKVLHELVEP
jgi:hypothetical protein